MGFYRKLPVTIEARQFSGGGTGGDIVDWIRASGGRAWYYEARTESIMPHRPGDLNKIDHPEHLEISTPGGEMSVPLGFWVLRNADGDFWACAPEAFTAAYEPVDAPG